VTGAHHVTTPKPIRPRHRATLAARGIVEAAAASVPAAASPSSAGRSTKEGQMFEPLEVPEPEPPDSDDDDGVVIVDDIN
jgi:hypothetical protein